MDTSGDTEGTNDQSRSSGSAMQVDFSIVDEKINKFLESGEFIRGSTLNNDEISSVLQKLDKKVSISNLDKEYNDFLNRYGSIYGAGVEISGLDKEFKPTKNFKNKVDYILGLQRGFEKRCQRHNIPNQEVKSYWLVGHIDQYDEYYMDFSKNGKGYIYSMSDDGISRLFARNFLEFLDNMFEQYETERSKETLDEKIDKFLVTEKFELGSQINRSQIDSVSQALGKNIDSNDLPDEYFQFLNKYGSISGEGFEIYGPTQDTENRAQYMESIQQEFENYLETVNEKIDVSKSKCWLIAKSSSGHKKYYINTSKKGAMGFISSIDMDPESWSLNQDVSDSFLGFLDKFFAEYKKNVQQ